MFRYNEIVNKKTDMKLCWNCDGSIGFQFETCPYCGVNLNVVPASKEPVKEVATTYSTSHQEWNETQKEKKETGDKKEFFALLLLLPGIVFLLFGIALLLFSTDGIFTLKWNQSFAYFYFLGAIPLLYCGYKSLK